MRVLMVDDSRTVLFIMKILMKSMGHTDISEAASAQEAQRLLSSQKFDLVLSDYNMPYMNGLELLKWIRVQDAE